MPEITSNDKVAVQSFINTQFGLNDPVLAADYAEIAMFLSVEQRWGPEVARLSGFLEEEYWVQTAKGFSNRLSTAISTVGAQLGFSNYSNGIVMAGFTDPGVFTSYVSKGSFWKDAVSSNHGEYSHSLQWLTLGLAAAGKRLSLRTTASYLFKNAVAHQSDKEFVVPGRNQPSKIYLWDFLVDCFDFGPDPDWQANTATHTARSPTHFNTRIQASKTWIGRHLRKRYAKRGWAAPGSPTPTSTKGYAIERATQKGYQQQHSNSGGNYVYEHSRVTTPVTVNKPAGPRGRLKGQLTISAGAWGAEAPRTATLQWTTRLGTVLRLTYLGNTAEFNAGCHDVTFDFGEDAGHRLTVLNLAKAKAS
ncbi:hypothetical protein JM946_23720 [Steroidobacter sp. S1-65]|uniref:DUF5636 domain-containing protein n=1 Tax=Steroidobacter gossypii TaxID=2805490 RepID=A0ABS1X3H1_9GAMM|nr:LirA/MavJ family T4SS effector [Steroidobacter gossypii]MBM0107765.1 hypothetical protein [Steroidobacter gossypii]